MFRLALPVLVLFLAVSVFVVSDRPLPKADFTYGSINDVNTLDLQRMSWMPDLRVARCLFQGLVRNDTFTHEYAAVPGVAERWEISEDGLTYTFHLRRDAKWSNGDTVRAGDFKYAWRRALLPDTASDYAGLFRVIDGGDAFYAWRERALTLFALDPFREQGSLADRCASILQAYELLASTELDEAGRAFVTSLEGHLETLRRVASAGGVDPDAASIRRVADIFDQPGVKKQVLTVTRGARARALWQLTEQKFDDMVGIEAPNDFLFRVRLAQRTPYFLSLCAFPVFYPVYPPLVKQYEPLDPDTARIKPESGWTRPPHLVSNGPFELKIWRFKRDMRMEQNPHYWDRDSLDIRSLAILSIADGNSAILAFNSGAADWLPDVTPTYRSEILAQKLAFYEEHKEAYDALVARGLDPIEIDRALPEDPRKNIHAFPSFATYFYNFNCSEKLADGRANPFHDGRVRRAFAMAVDKNRIVHEVRRQGETVASTLIPPGSIGGYEAPKGVPYDPEAARRLLADAGYPDGQGFITVEIVFNKDSGHDLIAQAIAKDWQRNLNVPVALATKELKVYRNDLKKHNFIVSRAGWYGDYGDPTTFLDINKSDDGNNDRNFVNAEFDGLLDQASVEPDPVRRMELLSRAESLIVDEQLPLIPIFHYATIYMFNPDKVSGISSHPRMEQSPYLADMLGDGFGREKPRALPPRTGTGFDMIGTGAEGES